MIGEVVLLEGMERYYDVWSKSLYWMDIVWYYMTWYLFWIWYCQCDNISYLCVTAAVYLSSALLLCNCNAVLTSHWSSLCKISDRWNGWTIFNIVCSLCGHSFCWLSLCKLCGLCADRLSTDWQFSLSLHCHR